HDRNAPAIGDERGVDRCLAEHNSDGLGAADAGRRHDVERAVAPVEEAVESVEYVGHADLGAKRDEGINLARHLVDEEELLLVGALQEHGSGAGALQELVAHALGKALAAWLGKRKDRKL